VKYNESRLTNEFMIVNFFVCTGKVVGLSTRLQGQDGILTTVSVIFSISQYNAKEVRCKEAKYNESRENNEFKGLTELIVCTGKVVGLLTRLGRGWGSRTTNSKD